MVWIQVLALWFVSCVTLSKLFTLSVPQFLYLKMRSNADKPKFCRMGTFYKMTGQYFPKVSRSWKENFKKTARLRNHPRLKETKETQQPNAMWAVRWDAGAGKGIRGTNNNWPYEYTSSLQPPAQRENSEECVWRCLPKTPCGRRLQSLTGTAWFLIRPLLAAAFHSLFPHSLPSVHSTSPINYLL